MTRGAERVTGALVLAVLAALGALTFVAPRFEEVFRGLPGGTEGLPRFTRMAMGVSAWLVKWWWACLLGVVAGAWIVRGRRRPR